MLRIVSTLHDISLVAMRLWMRAKINAIREWTMAAWTVPSNLSRIKMLAFTRELHKPPCVQT